MTSSGLDTSFYNWLNKEAQDLPDTMTSKPESNDLNVDDSFKTQHSQAASDCIIRSSGVNAFDSANNFDNFECTFPELNFNLFQPFPGVIHGNCMDDPIIDLGGICDIIGINSDEDSGLDSSADCVTARKQKLSAPVTQALLTASPSEGMPLAGSSHKEREDKGFDVFCTESNYSEPQGDIKTNSGETGQITTRQDSDSESQGRRFSAGHEKELLKSSGERRRGRLRSSVATSFHDSTDRTRKIIDDKNQGIRHSNEYGGRRTQSLKENRPMDSIIQIQCNKWFDSTIDGCNVLCSKLKGISSLESLRNDRNMKIELSKAYYSCKQFRDSMAKAQHNINSIGLKRKRKFSAEDQEEMKNPLKSKRSITPPTKKTRTEYQIPRPIQSPFEPFEPLYDRPEGLKGDTFKSIKRVISPIKKVPIRHSESSLCESSPQKLKQAQIPESHQDSKKQPLVGRLIFDISDLSEARFMHDSSHSRNTPKKPSQTSPISSGYRIPRISRRSNNH